MATVAAKGGRETNVLHVVEEMAPLISFQFGKSYNGPQILFHDPVKTLDQTTGDIWESYDEISQFGET